METRVISLYPHFHCLGGACPHSCCKGWQIPVDEDTYRRYENTRGAYGRALRFHVGTSADIHVIRKLLGRCPHWNADHVCQFQANGTPELMPVICRVYPRDGVRANDRMEVTLELSCIAMARTFLAHPGRLAFVPFAGRIESTWEMDNDDPSFYEYLVADREEMLDYLWDDAHTLDASWQALYAYVYRQHDLIVRDRIDEAKRVALTSDPQEMGIYWLGRDATYAFFSIKTIDRMIINHLNYGSLWLREPKFFRLIRLYMKYFSEKYVEEADHFFDEKVRRMMDDGYADKYRSYFSYNLQQLYTKAYETYFVLRQYLFAVLYVQLLMVFDLVDYLARGERIASVDRQSEILMLCEQGIRHNPSLTKNLLAIIREEFL